MVAWLLQNNFIRNHDTDQVGIITRALDEKETPYQLVDVIPFSDEMTVVYSNNVSILPEKTIPYGSTKLTKYAGRTQSWKGDFYVEETFRVDTWLRMRNDMLNSDVQIMTVAQAMEKFKLESSDSVWFIRPVKDLKAFSGTVTTAEEISKWMQSIDSGSFNFGPDAEVAISTPKTIKMEWRYFVVGGKIIDGSVYMIRGQRLIQRERDADVLAEAQAMADVWLPHETCVMDLALTNDGLRVVEFNSFNSSGFYYHDIPKIINAVTDYVEEL
jgi:hypothetical protein